MATTGPDLALTTDLPEPGLPMVYFDAAKLFPTDPAARHAAILSKWNFKGVAHFEAAHRLPPGRRCLGEILAASEAIRRWLLDYCTRQSGRQVPLVTESEIFRVLPAWFPYLPEAALESGKC